MSQPIWKYVGNIGDASPFDFGGFFVFVDETEVYPPEAEVLHEEGENEYGEPVRWTVYRFVLENCTYRNGILSDNQFHPDEPAWFAKTEEEHKERPQDTCYLLNLAKQLDMSVEDFAAMFCSVDPLERARAWREVGEYHGYNNLDEYPLEFTNREEVEAHYREKGFKA